MARRITQKQLKHDEFVEGVVGMEQWVEENWQKVAVGTAIAVVVVVAVVVWWAWSQKKVDEAGDLLALGVSEYQRIEESGFADTNGLSTALGTFDDVVRSAGGSNPGKVARYYRGATLYHLDRLDEARATLEEVVSDEGDFGTLGCSARMLLAQVQAASGQPDEAIGTLEAIAANEGSVIPPGQALMGIGRIQQAEGREEDARETWQRIVDEYPESGAVAEARQLLQ